MAAFNLRDFYSLELFQPLPQIKEPNYHIIVSYLFSCFTLMKIILMNMMENLMNNPMEVKSVSQRTAANRHKEISKMGWKRKSTDLLGTVQKCCVRSGEKED